MTLSTEKPFVNPFVKNEREQLASNFYENYVKSLEITAFRFKCM